MRWFGLVLGLAVFLAGCGSATVLPNCRYYPRHDLFKLMEVHTNLSAGEKQLDHIQALWGDRDQLILATDWLSPDRAHWFLRRKGKHDGEWIPLVAGADPVPMRTRVDLDEIDIRPGTFFTGSGGAPAFFHEVRVPGRVVDQVLEEWSPVLARTFEGIASSQRRRLDKGERRPTWEEFRRALDSVLSLESDRTSDSFDFGMLPFDEASLQRLARAGKVGDVQVRRDRARFTVRIPLSDRDAAEVFDTVRFLLPRLEEANGQGWFEAGLLRGMLAASRMEVVPSEGLKVTLDMEGAGAALLRYGWEGPDPPHLDDSFYEETIRGLTKRGIPVDERDRYRQVLEEFVADELVRPKK